MRKARIQIKRYHDNGYNDKVMYWKGQLNNAIIENDPTKLDLALEKLNYFVPKHSKYMRDERES